MRTITLNLPEQAIQSMDWLAVQQQISRDELVAELIREHERRERVRKRVREIAAAKQADPRRQLAFERIKEWRKKIKRVPEKTLKKDIEEAITAVRKENRK